MYYSQLVPSFHLGQSLIGPAVVQGLREGMALVAQHDMISQVWGPDAWMGYKRGGSSTSVPASTPRNVRLQKCAA